MAINTTFNPKTLSEFTKDHLEFSGQSLFLTCDASDTQSQDLSLTDDYLITGGALLVDGGTIDDEIFLQVVHPVAGVIKEFISGFRIASDTVKQLTIQLEYPAKIPAGLMLRCKYVSGSAGSTRKIAVNFFLHRVLE
jgi:hypothetical protein